MTDVVICCTSHSTASALMGGRLARRRPSQPSSSVPIAVQCLARLLREAPARALFTRASGASLLAPLLRSATTGSGGQPVAPSHQLLYEAGLCAWQLTFYKPAAQAMASSRITPALVNLARHAQKEKVRTLPSCLSALERYHGRIMPSLHVIV